MDTDMDIETAVACFQVQCRLRQRNVEGMFSQFGIPTTDIPNMVARRLSVGRVIGKVKIVSVHTMKAYRWCRSIAPLNLNLSIRWK
jgi:hypothetical protein